MVCAYGAEHDRKRLKELKGGALCKLDKMPRGILAGMESARICDVGHPLLSTVTSRYYKGIGSHKDNMVIYVQKHSNH